MIKTFRGMMEHNTIQKIRLSTKEGKIGYKIVKFQMMSNSPASVAVEAIMKIFKITQSSATPVFDFSDGNLLAGGYYVANTTPTAPSTQNVIFEQEIFNQDVYVTYFDNYGATEPCNYYLELETISLSDNAAAVSTLRDIRLNPQVGA